MKVENSIDDLSSSELRLLDTLASLVKQPDAYIHELDSLKNNSPSLRYCGE